MDTTTKSPRVLQSPSGSSSLHSQTESDSSEWGPSKKLESHKENAVVVGEAWAEVNDSEMSFGGAYGFQGFGMYLKSRSQLHPLPDIAGNQDVARFRYTLFTYYRRLFTVAFGLNLVALITILAVDRSVTSMVNAVSANLVVNGLARLHHVTNQMYLLASSLRRTTPLWLRKRIAKVSHYGGIHSGCGVGALFWYIAVVVIFTKEFVTSNPPTAHSVPLIVLLYLILGLLTAIIIAAYPSLRFKNHDLFEFTHRFSAWAILGLFWPVLIIFGSRQSHQEGTSLSSYLVRFPTFWFAVVNTVAFALPWITLRRIPVEPTVLSSHAIRLHFTYTRTAFGQGIAVSHHPLRDWHSFAAVPDLPPKPEGFSLIVSNAGDWTSGIIRNPPYRLWKRSIPAYGFGQTMLMFRKTLLIVTGSGIGPSLSLISAPNLPPIRVLWQTRAPMKTYGPSVLDWLSLLDPHAVVIDTDRWGRQDMLPIAWDLALEHGAEAVFVVSRPNVVRHLVFEFESRGVPAYGPLFDS